MKTLLLIPTAIFPYSVCLCLAYGFGSGNFTDDPIMEALGISCLVWALLALVCNTLFIIFSKKRSAIFLLKTALILKIIHIPSYVLLFALGLLMGFMFFMTFPFIIFLVFIDYVTLFFSGMISVFSLIKNVKYNAGLSIIAIVCQFFFCADIISLFVLWLISKNKSKHFPHRFVYKHIAKNGQTADRFLRPSSPRGKPVRQLWRTDCFSNRV